MIDWHVTGPLIVTGVFSFAMLGVSTWNAVLLVRDSEKLIKVRFFNFFTFFERFSNDSSISLYNSQIVYESLYNSQIVYESLYNSQIVYESKILMCLNMCVCVCLC